LKTLIDQGRECVDINGVHVPIFKERTQLRIFAGDHEGMISIAGQGSIRCQIVDFTQQQGARLRVFNPVKVGENTQLDSDLTGAHEAVVVWSQGQEIGVRFVA
jgi:archaellum component FlaG (FlaF/FlaG flagellin family)